MAKNEFLPFGIADGANVLTNDEYGKLIARTNGFSSGVAKSQELNKVWRQASVIAAVVAQFIAETNNQDVLDDGDLVALQKGLLSALKATVSSNVPNASLTTAGITKLSNATDSNAENVAATSKAVNQVNDNANSRLEKAKNGADIPNKPEFVSNIGAYPVTGGIVNGNIDATGYLSSTAVYEAGGIRVYSANNKPTPDDIGAYPKTGGVVNGNVDVTGYLSSTAVYEAGGIRVYSANNKPTPDDIGAYPKTGGIVNGNVDATGYVGGNGIYEVGGFRVYSPINKPTLNDIVFGAFSALPIGVPVPWPLAIPPVGWLKCNGSTFYAGQYPELEKV
ncbi:phage tail protein, partial [Xenorhabdus sp. PB61.4]|uniref:phage tail protein n=1 Tax=Xenorhabdus sp. PB61.4 TaxID=2788940 RepID=UPI001E54AD34